MIAIPSRAEHFPPLYDHGYRVSNRDCLGFVLALPIATLMWALLLLVVWRPTQTVLNADLLTIAACLALIVAVIAPLREPA